VPISGFKLPYLPAKLTTPDEEDDSEPEAYVDQFSAVAVSVKGQNITRAEQEKMARCDCGKDQGDIWL